MDFIDVDGIHLCYAKRNAHLGPTIFFFHGNSSSHATWVRQLDSAMLNGFRLIAFDHPAHGRSHPADTATASYSLPGIGKIMAKAVTLLVGDQPYLLVGVSLGTNIIAEMLNSLLHPAGIVLAGPCIVGEDYPPAMIMKPDTCIGLGFVDDLTDGDLQCLLKLIAAKIDETTSQQIIVDFNSVSNGFRGKLGRSIAEGRFSDQVMLVKNLSCPVLVIFGAADPAIYPDYLDNAGLPLWQEKIVKLPGACHWVHLDAPETFSRLLGEFGTSVVTPAGY